MKALGIALTKITSKFGLLSQKACIRLATETGYKLVDTEKQLGRTLNVNEIKSVFEEVLPKKCRPKILSTADEYRQFVGRDTANPPFALGCAFPYAKFKSPIWLNTELFPKSANKNSTIAHELEHALEANHRPASIICKNLLNLRYSIMSKISDVDTFSYEVYNPIRDKIEWNIKGPVIKCMNSNNSLNCLPKIADIAKQCGKTKGEFINELRSIVEEAGLSGKNKGLGTFFALKDLENIMRIETPAYKVGGAIKEYSANFKEGVYSYVTGYAEIYKETKKILRSERKLYFKNLLLGRLKKPNIYLREKDVLQYAQTKEDKAILKEILGELDSPQKYTLIKTLYKAEENPNNIKKLKSFLEATKDLPNGGYKNYLDNINIMGIDSKMLSNPDFIKIINIQKDKKPYIISDYMMKRVTSLPDEQLKKLAQLAELEDKSEFFSFWESLSKYTKNL